jgi:tetratricopeptide (TPR) repeat protein
MNPTEAYRAASAIPNGSGGADDPRVLHAVEEYLAELEAGRAPGRAAFLARHAAVADRLGEYLDGLELIHRAGSAAGPAAPAAEADLAGAEPLGDFLLVRELGRGGMGVVYEAVQRSLGRKVALKVLPFAAALDARQLQRFQNEARAAAGLQHPHVVAVFGVGCERGVHYYAMQLIDGQTLAAVIAALRDPLGADASLSSTVRAALSTRPDGARSRPYFRSVAELGVQAAEALDHAHQLGVVHRDVKPGNLMLDAAGKLWVTDFGLAQVATEAGLTLTGDLVGTLRYMSPEQALAKRVPVDHRTDVYSLGATLYELLTLRPAVAGNDRQELLRQIAFEEPVPPRRLDRTVPAELETVVLKALQKNPADRYATAGELADDLSRFLKNVPIRARPPTAGQRVRKWGRRHPALVAALAAALTAAVLVLGGSVGWIASDRHTRAMATQAEVGTALDESASWQQRRRIPEALMAARRAKGALAGGHADLALRKQVEARVDDLELLASLEEARLEGAAVKDDHFDYDFVDRRFGEIFRKSNLDVEGGSAEEAATRIGASTVVLELASFLDEWAMLRRAVNPQDEPRWQRLLRVAQTADPDAWRTQVRDALARRDQEALKRLTASDQALQLPPWTLNVVARVLARQGARQRAEALLRKAQQRYPDDFWLNHLIFQVIVLQDDPPRGEIRFAEAIPFLRVCVALRPQSPGARLNLGRALEDMGDLDGAIAEYREAIRLKNDYVDAYINLGGALRTNGDVDEAMAMCREAIRLNKDCAEAHVNLGNALQDKGQVDDAIAACCEAIRLKKDLPEAHISLASALRAKGDVDGAIAACREAIRLNKGLLPDAHNGLGNALHEKGDLDGAIAAYREALRLKKDFAGVYYNLGIVLHAKGDLDGAIAAYREAIHINENWAEAHCNLGHVLFAKGQFAEALLHFRHGHELGAKNPRWRYPSARWVRDAERLVELDAKLRQILEGKAKPAGAGERIDLAELCRLKHLHAAAARFYHEAFMADPRRVDDPENDFRYNAARAAALTGCGKSEDAAQLDDAERGRWRQQALDWLRADLTLMGKQLEGDKPRKVRVELQGRLRDWQQDPDFAGVRDEAALAKLPEKERQAWQQFWADVQQLLDRAGANPAAPAEKKP